MNKSAISEVNTREIGEVIKCLCFALGMYFFSKAQHKYSVMQFMEMFFRGIKVSTMECV